MHFVLANIETFMKNSVDQNIIKLLEIDIEIDGIPLTKSSSSQLWPILGHIFFGYKMKTNSPYPLKLMTSSITQSHDLNKSYTVQKEEFITSIPTQTLKIVNPDIQKETNQLIKALIREVNELKNMIPDPHNPERGSFTSVTTPASTKEDYLNIEHDIMSDKNKEHQLIVFSNKIKRKILKL